MICLAILVSPVVSVIGFGARGHRTPVQALFPYLEQAREMPCPPDFIIGLNCLINTLELLLILFSLINITFGE